jgi:phosphohistidine phosphatase SixA
MAVHLVRHGSAGSRPDWRGSDEARPLDTRGLQQAEAIAELLAGRPVERILSSRYARCVQTVEPLARLRGLAVEPIDALAEEADEARTLGLLKEVAQTEVVLCTHGNVIPVMLDHLRRNGTTFHDDPHVWAKGSVWTLEADGAGTVAHARYAPPAR